MVSARAYGDPQPDGSWDDWLVFFPLGRGTAIAPPSPETTQHTLADLAVWAAGLTPVYLEGALDRALGTLPLSSSSPSRTSQPSTSRTSRTIRERCVTPTPTADRHRRASEFPAKVMAPQFGDGRALALREREEITAFDRRAVTDGRDCEDLVGVRSIRRLKQHNCRVLILLTPARRSAGVGARRARAANPRTS